MALNNSRQAIIDYRQRRVAHYRLRGLTQREIADALTAEGTVNEKTGKPWSLGTVNADVRTLLGEWKEQAAGDIALHKGQVLAELREVTRTAWSSDDLSIVLRSLKQQSELLGLDEPQAISSNDFLIRVIYGNGRNDGQPEETS